MLENECALASSDREALRSSRCASGHRAYLEGDAGLRGARHCGGRNFAGRLERAPPRAPAGRSPHRERGDGRRGDPLAPLDWVTVYAMAVNEENAAGGRVVTAPTNGAAGVVPAVAHYYERFTPESDHEGIVRFFLLRRPSAFFIRRMPPSAARRLAARARWAWPAPWPPED
jgi:hypothetical protein